MRLFRKLKRINLVFSSPKVLFNRIPEQLVILPVHTVELPDLRLRELTEILLHEGVRGALGRGVELGDPGVFDTHGTEVGENAGGSEDVIQLEIKKKIASFVVHTETWAF